MDTVLANSTNRPSIDLDSSNNPVVSWEETVGTSLNIYVKKWNGTAWVAMDGSATNTPLDIVPTQDASSPSLILNNANRPVVAWHEKEVGSSTNYNVYVKRWNGSAWDQLGSAVDTNISQSTINPSLALDSGGAPTVAIQQANNIYVRRFNNTSLLWVTQGGSAALDVVTTRSAQLPSLAIGYGNELFVTWQEQVATGNFDIFAKKRSGSSWIPLTPTNTELDVSQASDARRPDLILRTDNNPVVVWDEKATTTGATENIYVKLF